MYSLLMLAFAGFVLSFGLTPLIRDLALRCGWVDPPGERKIHTGPIPRVGGLAIAIAYTTAFGVLFLLPLSGSHIARGGLSLAVRLFPAAVVVFGTGLLDDLVGLKPWQKLVGQGAGAILACWAGIQIHGVGGHAIASAWWAVPLTLFWLIGCMNAVNLIDGMDGLACGVGLFATTTCLMAALLGSDMRLAFATAPLVGALLGFLRYNFNPASIFLGDCGSLLIGFLLGCYGVLWSQKSVTLLGMTAPLMALALPLLDTGLAIVRRFLKGRPIFEADCGHVHHKLLARGFTPRRAAIVLYGMCSLGATCSLLSSVVGNRFNGLIVVLFCVATWIGIQHLGYIEFSAAGHLMLPNTMRKILSAQISVRQFEESLKAAQSMDECWGAVEEASSSLGLEHVQLRFNGAIHRARVGKFHPGDCWNLSIPLDEHASVSFLVPFEGRLQPMALATFATALRNTLAPRLSELLEGEQQLSHNENRIVRVFRAAAGNSK